MLDFISNNAGLLVGGTGGGIVLYILKKIPNEETDAYSVFESSFLQELKILKEQDHDFNKVLISEMRKQAQPICENIFPAILEEFGQFKVISIEEQLMEDIDEFDANGRKFKGFIDLVDNFVGGALRGLIKGLRSDK